MLIGLQYSLLYTNTGQINFRSTRCESGPNQMRREKYVEKKPKLKSWLELYNNFYEGFRQKAAKGWSEILLFLQQRPVKVSDLLYPSTLGTSDFDAQMSGIEFWKGDENLRPFYKKNVSG